MWLSGTRAFGWSQQQVQRPSGRSLHELFKNTEETSEALKESMGRACRGRGSCRVVYMRFLPAPPTFLWHQIQILQNKSNSKIRQRHLDFTEVVMEAGSPHHGNFINLPMDACLSPDTMLSFPLITPSHPLFIACLSYPEQFHPSALQFSLPSNHLPSYLGMREPSYILFWTFSPLLKNVGI